MKLLEYNIGEGVRAFSTLREGGVGTGAYAGFNITHYCGDEERAVRHNRMLLCNELGISDKRLLLPRQTHGCDIVHIDDSFMSLTAEEQKTMLHAKDAVITEQRRLCIGVSTADCVPILLYDAVNGVVAAVHAGWRGTVAHIAEKCIGEMIERYNCIPADIRAIIGPSISLEAFEVGDEVYDIFAAAFRMEQIACKIEGKWHIDLWEANRRQLLAKGVPATTIEVCGICTYSQYSDFFSARRLGINSGRIFNGIMLL